MTFLDAPPGTATLCRFPNGRTLLLDAGTAQNNVLERFLAGQGITRLDVLVLTRLKPDNLAAAQELLKNVRVSNVILPDEPDYDRQSAVLAELARTRGARVAVAVQGMEVQGLGAQVRVLSPASWMRALYREHRVNRNDLSPVVRLEYESLAVLFPGDLEHAGLLNRLDGPVQVLVSPKNASIQANSEQLLDLARPQVLVVACRPRLPAPLHERLDCRLIQVCNLRQDGAALLTCVAGRASIRQQTAGPDF